LSFYAISDCLHQNKLSFYAFRKTSVQYLPTKFLSLKKFMCFSDGSAAQYKNRIMINIYHDQDFGLWSMALLYNKPWKETTRWNGKETEKAGWKEKSTESA
jgi:hypothetical protein